MPAVHKSTRWRRARRAHIVLACTSAANAKHTSSFTLGTPKTPETIELVQVQTVHICRQGVGCMDWCYART
jgi:hypothetical protein